MKCWVSKEYLGPVGERHRRLKRRRCLSLLLLIAALAFLFAVISATI